MTLLRYQISRGTAAAWAAANPVLREGEQGLETDTRLVRMGDGVTPFNSLPAYLFSASVFGQRLLDDPDAKTARETLGSFDTIADCQADTTLTTSNTTAGDIITAQGFRYQVVASGGDLTTAGGVQLIRLNARRTTAAAAIATMPDGYVAAMDGLLYIVDSTVTGTDSATSDLGVDGLLPYGQATLGHFGGDRTGATDSGPALERGLAISHSIDLGGEMNTWMFSTQVGVPDQTLYADKQYEIFGQGANVVVAGVDELFTSAGFKAAPTSTTNLYAAKINVSGLNFTETATSVLFDADHLYNLFIHHNSFAGISTVFKSSHAKDGGYADGYIQSLFVTHNHFSNCGWVCNAKRAFNTHFDQNQYEACTKGVYINGDGQTAIAGFSFTNSQFEGGGVALDLGDFVGLKVSNIYMESNTVGDVAAYGCYIRLKKVGPSQLMSGEISSINCSMSSGQIADTSFYMLGFDGLTVGLDNLDIGSCWTNGHLFADDVVKNQESNIGASTPRSPRTPATALVDYQSTGLIVTHAANLSGADYTVATFTLPDFATLGQATRPFVADIRMFMQHKTAGSVVVGADYFDLRLLIQGPEGSGSDNNVWASIALVNHLEAQTGQGIDGADPTALSVGHFTAPAVSISEAAGVFSIVINGFAVTSVPSFGAASQMQNNITCKIMARNNGGAKGLGDGLVFSA